jgi:signal transduction histidine kinase
LQLDDGDAELRQLVDEGALLIADYGAERLASPALRELLRRLDARSLMIVPLRIHEELVATATFVGSGEAAHRYGAEDLALAQELAQRAAQIVENARLHQQLRKSDERFRVALEHARIHVFEVDRQLRYRWVGRPVGDDARGSPIGRTITEFNTGSGTAELAELVQRAIDSGQAITAEVDYERLGQSLCVLASVKPLRDAGGAIVGAIGAATDISETKRVQAELTRALGFRDRMIGVLGHDLRNPLGAVSGLAGLVLLDTTLPSEIRGHVEHIAEASRRTLEMIKTLLDFAQSRFKEGLPVAPSPCDLSEIAAAAVEDCRAAHRGRFIELEAPPQVTGVWDGARLAQVVTNLVGNALVHGEWKAPVRVALAVADDDVVLRVSNRGPMIPRELIPSLFEPFRQGAAADGATRPRGLGLGLYIVDQIVRAHGGSISVESSPAETTFSVHLKR